jgi:hypothetical protein
MHLEQGTECKMAILRPTTIDDTGFFRLPLGSGNQRPGSPLVGELRYNSSRNEIESFNGSFWSNNTRKDILNPTNLVLNVDAGEARSYSGIGTTWTDISGNSNNGTLGSSVSFLGLNNGQLQFSNNDRVTIPSSSSINFAGTQQYTAMAWIYPTASSGTWGGIFSKGNTQQWAATFNKINNYIHFETNQGGVGPVDSSNGSVPYNQWTHVAIRFNGTAKQIFINGESNITQTATALNSTSNTEELRIGEGNTGEYFNGSIGLTQVYSRALTDQEIRSSFNANRTRFNGIKNFGSRANPAKSALEIKEEYPDIPDGAYWIDLPTVGPSNTFCIMNSAFNGGGWMMSMKATTGTTFNYSSNLWTTANTLNPTQTNQNNGDAKFEVFNRFLAKDMMARWPDIGAGGGIPGVGNWVWLENNFILGNRATQLAFHSSPSSFPRWNGGTGNGGSGNFISDALVTPNWGSPWSTQVDIRFYGFNYSPFGSQQARCRWGFGWNENGEGLFPSSGGGAPGSNDVSGGIGMDGNYGSLSAGDRINCCQNRTGINRSARVEVYVR